MQNLIRYGIVIVVVAAIGGCGIFYYKSQAQKFESELMKTQVELEKVKADADTVKETLIQMQQAKLESEKMVAELNKIIEKWNSLTTYDEKINMLQTLGKRRNVLIPEGIE